MTRAEEPPSVRSGGAVLRVSLVSGLRAEGRSAICRGLAGSPEGRPETEELSDDSDDSGEFAGYLAECLLEDARAGATGHTVIDLEAQADVMEVGFVVESVFESARPDGPSPELSELITVATVHDIHRWLLSPHPTPEDDFDTAEVLASQLEFATLIVLEDADDAPRGRLRSTLGLLYRLNPTARVVRESDLGRRPRHPSPGRGCARRLGQHLGWTLALANQQVETGLQHDVDTVVFRDPRPFHPGRLSDAIREKLTPDRVGRIARSRGLVQLATRAEQIGSWKSAGDTVSLDPAGMSSWDPNAPSGQELVFFGEHLNRRQIIAALNDALLTSSELLASPMHWAGYGDPFPAWPASHDH